MPIYTYEHPNGLQQVQVVQSMNEEHRYFYDGVEWKRVFDSPHSTIDSFSKLSPFDKDGFVKRTAKKGMTVGDMWDESKKMSERREASVGKDFVKENAVNTYKHRTGKPHPHALPKTKFV
jgi:hypothetical protein